VLAADSLVDEIICDHLEMRGIEASVAAAHAAGLRAVVAAPRVIKPAEDGLWRVLVAAGADAILVRSAGLLAQLADARDGAADGEALGGLALHGDFSLNAANAPSARLLLASGLQRLTPTHDCNGAQAAELARRLGAADAARLELIVHTHLPIFHTEHCVFARTLSDGNSFADCGHPCERHTVHLRHSDGHDHLLLADMGCRNTLFNAQAQSGAHFVRQWADAGVGRLRIELVDEPADVAVALVEMYAALVRGAASAHEVLGFVAERARDSNGRLHGVSEGSLKVQREREWGSMKRTAAASAH
jgi:collagenase-like PrtC family protease